MSQINAKHVNQISVNLVRVVKIRVHVNHLDVKPANLAKTLAPASLVKIGVVVTVATLVILVSLQER